jgi:hypothetical protein
MWTRLAATARRGFPGRRIQVRLRGVGAFRRQPPRACEFFLQLAARFGDLLDQPFDPVEPFALGVAIAGHATVSNILDALSLATMVGRT